MLETYNITGSDYDIRRATENCPLLVELRHSLGIRAVSSNKTIGTGGSGASGVVVVEEVVFGSARCLLAVLPAVPLRCPGGGQRDQVQDGGTGKDGRGGKGAILQHPLRHRQDCEKHPYAPHKNKSRIQWK